MAAGPQHEISNVEAGPGRLSFEARIEGVEPKQIWFRTESEAEPYAEAALAASLMPAMRSGGTLKMSEPISPRVLRNQSEFQAIQRAWSFDWSFGDPPLREVEVEAPTRAPGPRSPSGRVAAFLSGGVDSWSTVLSEPELTDLIFVQGIDILPRLSHQEKLAEQVEQQLGAAAGELGLRLHRVDTNLRELSDPLARWEAYYGCAMTAVALFLGGAFDRVLIAGDSDYEVQVKLGANWMVDQLWSTEDLEIVDAGGRLSRMQRVEQIASHPVVQKSLRVCWENPGGAYNCGHCRKCLMTMAALEIVGALDAVETLPSKTDLDALAAIEVAQPVSLTLWQDMLDTARAAGKTELEGAIGVVVAGAKRALGLPPGYRRRHAPGPPPAAHEREHSTGRLLATAKTARAVANSSALAFLVGSYDGSGNYGDIVQLDGALRMLGKLDGGLLVLPVLERQFAATHRSLASDLLHEPEHVLYFDDGNGEFDDDLVPLAPAPPHFALSYLYGGGFLNPSWGERKLAMLRAVEQAVKGAGAVTRIASGQQVDAGWIAGLDPADKGMLGSFELLGARDDASAEALAQFVGAAAAPNGGDDAVGVLVAAGEGEPGAESAGLEVNVHIAEHPWVTDRPDEVREFDVGLLAELSQLIGQPLRVRPLLAYLDPRVDERPGLERFTAACEERGIEVGEPRVLRPAGIAELSPELGGAALTVSCSYHVALTSLLLAVPTVILRDNPYYDQKARGLLADFGLPDSFSPGSDEGPGRCAAEIATVLADERGREEARRQLREAAQRVRQRRARVETELLARVAAGAIAAASEAPGAAIDHAEPFEQQAEEGDRQAGEAQAKLDEVLRSSSWKITAPLRRLSGARRGEAGAAADVPSHEIADLVRGPGELSFEARIEGVEPKRIWFRSESEVEPYAEAALATSLMPAMRLGGTLRMSEPISPRMLRTQREFQAIQRAWSLEWSFGDPPLREVEVIAPVRPVQRRQPVGRVAAFFSGGVDSWSTVLGDPEVTDLIFVRGIDILPRLSHQEGLADVVEARLREAAAELGMRLHVVETNLRELSEPGDPSEPLARWETYYGCAVAAVALFLGDAFDRVLITGDSDYEVQEKFGANWMVDQLWSTESLEIVDEGGRFSRFERTARIAAHPVVRKSLRVCWENPGGAYNCGRCRKCLLTMAALEALDALEATETFPSEIDLELLETLEMPMLVILTLWEDVLDGLRGAGKPELEQAVAGAVARGREQLGLPPGHRRRNTPPPGEIAPSGSTEAEARATLEEVLDSRSWKLTAPLRRLANLRRKS